jgi:hypothetical protein
MFAAVTVKVTGQEWSGAAAFEEVDDGVGDLAQRVSAQPAQ